jgi:hypothetical protein
VASTTPYTFASPSSCSFFPITRRCLGEDAIPNVGQARPEHGCNNLGVWLPKLHMHFTSMSIIPFIMHLFGLYQECATYFIKLVSKVVAYEMCVVQHIDVTWCGNS